MERINEVSKPPLKLASDCAWLVLSGLYMNDAQIYQQSNIAWKRIFDHTMDIPWQIEQIR
jgi:hypothetical protein